MAIFRGLVSRLRNLEPEVFPIVLIMSGGACGSIGFAIHKLLTDQHLNRTPHLYGKARTYDPHSDH